MKDWMTSIERTQNFSIMTGIRKISWLSSTKFPFLLMAFKRSLLSSFYPLILFTVDEMSILYNDAWIMHFTCPTLII